MLQCLMHLEDQLQSIYLKSKLLAEYIKVHRRVFSHELASLHEYNNFCLYNNNNNNTNNNNARGTSFLFQWLSIFIQRFHAILLLDSFVKEEEE